MRYASDHSDDCARAGRMASAAMFHVKHCRGFAAGAFPETRFPKNQCLCQLSVEGVKTGDRASPVTGAGRGAIHPGAGILDVLKQQLPRAPEQAVPLDLWCKLGELEPHTYNLDETEYSHA